MIKHEKNRNGKMRKTGKNGREPLTPVRDCGGSVGKPEPTTSKFVCNSALVIVFDAFSSATDFAIIASVGLHFQNSFRQIRATGTIELLGVAWVSPAHAVLIEQLCN